MTDRPVAGPDVDETLGEGTLERPPTGPELEELLRQRMAHALLRAACPADAETREARVQSVLAALPRGRVVSFGRLAAAAAVVLGVGLSLKMMLGGDNRLAAAVSAARACLDQDIDRHFDLRVSESELDDAFTQVGTHELFTCPKGYFLLNGNGRYGKFRIGRPGLGKAMWARLGDDADPRMDEEKLIAALMQMGGGTIDVGFLDLQRVLDTLPGADDLAFAGEEVDGERRVDRYEGQWKPTLLFGGLERASVAFDQKTREVVRMCLDVRNPLGAKRKRLEFAYRGTVAKDPDRYLPPPK